MANCMHITFTIKKVKPSLEKNTTVEDAHIIATNIQNYNITKEAGDSSHDTYGTSLTMMAEEYRLVNYYEEKIFRLEYVGHS
jgi:hypothetical protein